MNNATPQIPVEILDATTVYIRGESIAIPPGVDPDQAVMSYLQLEAAGIGQPINASINDRRYSVKAMLTVNPDGTTSPGTASAATASPLSQVLTPASKDQHPLAAIQSLAAQGHIEVAIEQADRHLLQLSTDAALGPQHPDTLEAAETRAHLAWITRDYPYAYRTWSWIAATWSELLGRCPQTGAHDHNPCRHVAVTSRNAAAAWMQLPAEEAAVASEEVLALLEHNSGSPNTPAAQAIRSRLAEFTAQMA